MSFSFDNNVKLYLSALNKDYPRYQAWEFLWDYTQRHSTRKSLIATDKNIELTALHIGLYLANWGMFRGSGSLLDLNLNFYKDLSVFLFTKIPIEFWKLTFEDFNPENREKAGVSQALYDSAVKKISGFKISWTNTLITKLLLGIWGNCPANDTYFKYGLSFYKKNNPKVNLRGRLTVSGLLLSDLYLLVNNNNWRIDTYKTREGKNIYPAGKVIDMAFFQYGYDMIRANQQKHA